MMTDWFHSIFNCLFGILFMDQISNISCQGTCTNNTFGPFCNVDCHCKGQCNPTNGSCDSLGCANGYSGPTCQIYKLNLIGQPVVMSSVQMADARWGPVYNITNQNWTFDGRYAVDGDWTDSGGQYAQTYANGSEYAWIMISLGNVTGRIYQVKIALPDYGKWYNLFAKFYITNDTLENRSFIYGNWDSSTTMLSVNNTFSPNAPFLAKWLILYNERLPGVSYYNSNAQNVNASDGAVASMAEVEVSVCPRGVSGQFCEKLCLPACVNYECSFITVPFCAQGCAPGYYGPQCTLTAEVYVFPTGPSNRFVYEEFEFILIGGSVRENTQFSIDKSRVRLCTFKSSKNWWTYTEKYENSLTFYNYMQNTYGFSLPIELRQINTKYLLTKARFYNPGFNPMNVWMDNGPSLLKRKASLFIVNQHLGQQCIQQTTVNVYGATEVEKSQSYPHLIQDVNVYVFKKQENITSIVDVLFGSSTIHTNCSHIQITEYNWTVGVPSPDCYLFVPEEINVPSINTSSRTFHIPGLTLNYGIYIIEAKVNVTATAGRAYSIGQQYVKIVKTPLVAVLDGGLSRNVLWSENLTLDALSTYDPDNIIMQNRMSYTWMCRTGDGGICWFNSNLTSVVVTGFSLSLSGPVIHFIQHSLLAGSVYIFTVEVTGTDGGFSFKSSTEQIIQVVDDSDPILMISCFNNCGDKITHLEELTLNVVALSSLAVQKYEWHVSTDNISNYIPDNYVDTNTTTGRYRHGISFKPGFFVVGRLYYVSAICDLVVNITMKLYYVVIVNESPGLGTCELNPASGYELTTMFQIDCTGFLDDDVPLTYSLYNIVNDQEILIYASSEPTFNDTILPAGTGNNYNISLRMHVADSYGSITTHDFSGQVYPLGYNKTLGGLQNGTDVLSSIEQLVNDTSVTASLQYIHAITTTLVTTTLVKDKTQTQNETSVHHQRREMVSNKILTLVLDVNVTDIHELVQVTEITNSITNVSTGMSQSLMDTSVNVIDKLASTVQTVPTKFASEKRNVAKNIIKTIGHTVKLQTSEVVHHGNETTKKEIKNFDNMQQQQKVLQTLEQNNKKMLSALEVVMDTLADTMKVVQEPITMEEEDLELVISRSEGVEDLADWEYSATRQLDQEGGMQNFSVTVVVPESQSLLASVPQFGINNFSSVTELVVLDENPYAWDESFYEYVTTPAMQMIIKDQSHNDLAIRNLQKPFNMYLSTNVEEKDVSLLMLPITYNTVTNLTVTSEDITRFLKVAVPHSGDKMIMFYVKPKTTNATLLVYMSERENDITGYRIRREGVTMPRPSSSLPKYKNLVQSSDILFFNASSLARTTLYLGIAVENDLKLDIDVSMSNDSSESTLIAANISIYFEAYAASCVYFDTPGDKWAGDGCEVTIFSSVSQLHCWCNHLTPLAGGFMVLPNRIDPVTDIKLFLTFFSNPVVVCTVAAVWCMYFVLLILVRKKDKADAIKGGVHILADNTKEDKYAYLVGIVTGWWRNAGTTANVYLGLNGKLGKSAKHVMTSGAGLHFNTGSEDWFVLTTQESLHDLESVTVWHDNSGRNPAWFLKQIVVKDLQTDQVWHFIYNDWLAIDQAHAALKATIPAVVPSELTKHSLYQFVFMSAKDLQQNHLWISIFARPAFSTFTRSQRLTCALSFLLSTMLTSIMFHGVPTDNAEDQIGVGEITLSLTDLIIGIESSLIMFPITFLIVQLFTRLAVRPVIKKGETLGSHASVYLEENTRQLMENGNMSEKKHVKEKKKKQFKLPWWFLYVAWFLVISTSLVSSFFVMLYGLKYGYQRSIDWLVSFFTAFFQSALVNQPAKVLCVALFLTLIFKKSVQFEILSRKEDLHLDKNEELAQGVILKRQGVIQKDTPLVVKDAPPEHTINSVKAKLKKEAQIVTILRELTVHFLFLTLILYIVHQRRDISLKFMTNERIENIFHKPEHNHTEMDFFEISKIEEVWEYLDEVALSNLADFAKIPFQNRIFFLLGRARIRQKRLSSDQCPFIDNSLILALVGNTCMDQSLLQNEETGIFNQSWKYPVFKAINTSETFKPWKYQTASQLQTLPITGRLSIYTGGGYVADLPTDRAESSKTLKHLKESEWLDLKTRVLFLEFNLYIPDANLFTFAVFMLEFSIGGLFPSCKLFTAKLYPYTGDLRTVLLVCEGLFCLFVIGFTWVEIQKLRQQGRRTYFRNSENYLEIVLIFWAIVVIGLFIQRNRIIGSTLNDYKTLKSTGYTSFHAAVFWDSVLGYNTAFFVLLSVLKVFKQFQFNERNALFSRTLYNCKESIGYFIFMMFIAISCCSHFGFLIFGQSDENFSSMGTTIVTLFDMLIGITDYHGLQEINPVIGPAFYFLIIFVLRMGLVYLVASIVVESFKIVRSKYELKDIPVTKYIHYNLFKLLGFRMENWDQ